MSANNSYSGAITITPPLTATEIRRAPQADSAWDAHLRIVESAVETDQGEILTRIADAIAPPTERCNGYEVEKQIQALVALFADGHQFAGFIEVRWDPGYDDPIPQRYVVRDGRVETITPRLAWPDGEAI